MKLGRIRAAARSTIHQLHERLVWRWRTFAGTAPESVTQAPARLPRFMHFLNECVSEQDVRTHGLDELMRQFNPRRWRHGRPRGFMHLWAIDREHGIFFYRVSSESDESMCILDWQGRRAQFNIRRMEIGLPRFGDAAFDSAFVWQLSDLDFSEMAALPRHGLIEVIKKALRGFGYRGTIRHTPVSAFGSIY